MGWQKANFINVRDNSNKSEQMCFVKDRNICEMFPQDFELKEAKEDGQAAITVSE